MKTFAAIIILILTSPIWISVGCVMGLLGIIFAIPAGIIWLMEWAWNVLDVPRKPTPKRYERLL